MILLVDDDLDVLELLRGAIEKDGHRTTTFLDAAMALRWLDEHREVALIISDVSMPIMDGFTFKREYSRRYPNRHVPFLFLSSRTGADDVAAGLDLGADDYLNKPVHPKVLRAKIRAVLRRTRTYSVPIFRGDISKFPFVKLLQFCESLKLNGDVVVEGGGVEATVRLTAGEFEYGESAVGDEIFEQLLELKEGTFEIHADKVDFSEIEFASSIAPGSPISDQATSSSIEAEGALSGDAGEALTSPPMGQLSAIKVGERTFQLQTEVNLSSPIRTVTIVVLDGRTLLKRESEPLGSDADFTALIRQQHESVEEEVREQLSRRLKDKAKTEDESPRSVFNRLFEEGTDEFMRRNYEAAVRVWEEAGVLDPDNKALNVNLQIARRKLAPDNAV